MSQKSSTTDSGPQPLEYSPFNYTFSKTTGWFPGDLAVPQHQSGSVGMNNLIASLSSGGSTSSLSASRAMNFASVAASGISASMSTTTAQMSSVPGVNGPIVSAIGKPLDGVPVHPSPMSPTETHDHGRADAAKAPGYRGASSMGSPVMRLPQPPLQSVPNFPLDLGQALSGLSQMNFNSRPNYGGQYQPPADLGLLNSQQPVNGGSQMMFQQNNRCGNTNFIQEFSRCPSLPFSSTDFCGVLHVLLLFTTTCSGLPSCPFTLRCTILSYYFFQPQFLYLARSFFYPNPNSV